MDMEALQKTIPDDDTEFQAQNFGAAHGAAAPAETDRLFMEQFEVLWAQRTAETKSTRGGDDRQF